MRFGDGPASSYHVAADRWMCSAGSYLVGGRRYHRWAQWPGKMFGPGDPGCGGQVTSALREVLGDAEAGLLFDLGADLVHVCPSTNHHRALEWCWCTECLTGGARQ